MSEALERNINEVEQDKAIAWDKSAKGKGNRWRMMRDVVAALAMRPLNLMQAQDAMMRLRGITRAKTHEMMMELQGAGDIKEVAGKLGDAPFSGWAATDRGVHFWVGSRLKIPAGIMRVLPTMVAIPEAEERQVPGGPGGE